MNENEGLEKKVEKAITKERRLENNPIKPNALALIPFVVFIVVYLGSGIIGILPVPGPAGSGYRCDYGIYPYPGQ